jgi:phenylpropionate dioxygenase-like ring-hydroxylating dioxygenase large terminal subunit
MFVNQRHLEYLLSARDYFSPEVHREEIERVLRPAWQFVGDRSELPRRGDSLALDLFGHPVTVRNDGGRYSAHEAGEDGTPRACRVANCGDLLFVALTDEAPPLREFLEPFFGDFAGRFAAPAWKMRWAWEYDCPCNWKVPAENTLESYHIPALHRKTFGSLYPSEANSKHLLEERYTVLEYDSGEDPRVLRYQAPLVRWMGAEPTNMYFHRHIHPNFIAVTTDTFNYALTYIPTSPTTMRIRVRMYGFQGAKRGLLTKLLARVCWHFGRDMMKRIMLEDWDVFADQQRGLEVSRHKGVIGTREERIYVFHRWWMDRMGRHVGRGGEPITRPINTTAATPTRPDPIAAV